MPAKPGRRPRTLAASTADEGSGTTSEVPTGRTWVSTIEISPRMAPQMASTRSEVGTPAATASLSTSAARRAARWAAGGSKTSRARAKEVIDALAARSSGAATGLLVALREPIPPFCVNLATPYGSRTRPLTSAGVNRHKFTLSVAHCHDTWSSAEFVARCGPNQDSSRIKKQSIARPSR